MNDKRLIDMVRKYPVLYDLTNPNYMDTEYKNNIWSEIGKEMNIPETTCKARWSNIRDNFRKSLRKHKIVSTQQGKTMKCYKYSQQLRFLTEFFDKKEAIINSDNEVRNQDLKSDDETILNQMVCEPAWPKTEPIFQDSTPEIKNSVAVELQTCTSSNSQQTDSAEYPIPRKKVKHVSTACPPKSVAATVMEYIIKKNESVRSSSALPQDPVDAFLAGIAPVLKKLPPRNWHCAKADLFAIAQKYEFKMLTEQKELVETPSVLTSPTASISGEPSPACQQESISTCSTPSFREQPSPTDNYHQPT